MLVPLAQPRLIPLIFSSRYLQDSSLSRLPSHRFCWSHPCRPFRASHGMLSKSLLWLWYPVTSVGSSCSSLWSLWTASGPRRNTAAARVHDGHSSERLSCKSHSVLPDYLSTFIHVQHQGTALTLRCPIRTITLCTQRPRRWGCPRLQRCASPNPHPLSAVIISTAGSSRTKLLCWSACPTGRGRRFLARKDVGDAAASSELLGRQCRYHIWSLGNIAVPRIDGGQGERSNVRAGQLSHPLQVFRSAPTPLSDTLILQPGGGWRGH
jgi:hypothetical protein